MSDIDDIIESSNEKELERIIQKAKAKIYEINHPEPNFNDVLKSYNNPYLIMTEYEHYDYKTSSNFNFDGDVHPFEAGHDPEKFVVNTKVSLDIGCADLEYFKENNEYWRNDEEIETFELLYDNVRLDLNPGRFDNHEDWYYIHKKEKYEEKFEKIVKKFNKYNKTKFSSEKVFEFFNELRDVMHSM